jgi:hypothetical protein
MSVLRVTSAADICNQYITRIKQTFDRQRCGETTDHGIPNEQFGFMLTDCWRTEEFCTFYEATWYDWMSCGDNTRESYYSVNRATGKVASISDFVSEQDIPKLAELLLKYLKNYSGQLWTHPGFEWVATQPIELLRQMNGCALIREGLIIYYYPYEIGCGADGQFNATIPYQELYGILYSE